MPDPEAVRLVADRWLAKALNDLEAARLMLDAADRIDPWVATFHAQQAAEKALKALLVRDQVPFPRTHDLERLLGMLPASFDLPSASGLAMLSEFAIDGRYPDLGPESGPSRADALAAVELAAEVVDAARQALG